MTLSPFPFHAYLQSTLIEPSSKKQLDQFFPSPLVTPAVELSSKCARNAGDAGGVDNGQPNEMHLKPPESAALKSTVCRENETQTSLAQRTPERAAHKSNNDIPFWLRPSPVQMYPYNFIMAVRKKLEAITNPVSKPRVSRPIEATPSSTTLKSPVSRPNTHFTSVFRHNLDKTDPSESDRSLADVEHPNHKAESVADRSETGSNDLDANPNESAAHRVSQLLVHSSEPEEYSMHFSPAYTSHKPTSKKLEASQKARDSQDTLSMSSSILSQSSPEKRGHGKRLASESVRNAESEQRQMSPLSTDHVNGLHIQSRNISRNSSAEKVRQSNSSIVESSQGHGESQQPSERPEDVQKLLRDFNESLSMVIKVNKHLRRVLSTPPSRHSSSKTQPSSKQSSKYSDDFEQSSGTLRPSTDGGAILRTEASIKQDITSLKTVTLVTTESNTNLDASRTTSNIVESIAEFSNHINTQISVQSSISNHVDTATITNSVAFSAHQTKTSSTQIQEELSQLSESQSNDLKSISLSIAKKSFSSDTEQHSETVDSIRKHIAGEPDVLNQSIGSDIFEMFNKPDMLATGKDVSWSEHNVSYASLGMVSRIYLLSTSHFYSHLLC